MEHFHNKNDRIQMLHNLHSFHHSLDFTHEINIGVLTVSDSCFAGHKTDVSGKTLLDIISQGNLIPKSKVVHYEIVPDDKSEISHILLKWCHEEKCQVIFTTGGTGFSPRDVTPEATRHVIDKETPGIMHAIMNHSLNVTPLAQLSRGVSGIRKKTLIINLPGSVKAATECLSFVKDILPHAVAVITDDLDSVNKTHEHLHDHDNVPRSKVSLRGVALRARHSSYPLIEVKEALEIIEKVVEPNEVVKLSLTQSLDHVLAADVRAVDPFPPFRASVKDGYAVLTSDGAGIRQVLDVVEAGGTTHSPVTVGKCVRINTGAPVPEGADAVVQVEDTKLVEATPDGSAELYIEICKAPSFHQDIRPIGCDIEKDSIVLEQGTLLKAAEVGLLATVGQSVVSVYKKPIIGLLSTGNELQNHSSESLRPGHIRDSNKIALAALFKQMSFETIDCGIAADTPESLLTMIEKAFYKCDILVTTGGVSMGERDLVKQVLIADFDATIHFGRLNMKPGKPSTFATCPHFNHTKYIFALPGNPVSALVTAQLLVIQALKRMCYINTEDSAITVTLGHNFKLDPQRPEYHRAILRWTENGPVAESTGSQISSRLASMLSVDCLLLLPAQTETQKELLKGEKVKAYLLKS